MTYFQRRRAEILGKRKRKPKALPPELRWKHGGGQPPGGQRMYYAMKRLTEAFG